MYPACIKCSPQHAAHTYVSFKIKVNVNSRLYQFICSVLLSASSLSSLVCTTRTQLHLRHMIPDVNYNTVNVNCFQHVQTHTAIQSYNSILLCTHVNVWVTVTSSFSVPLIKRLQFTHYACAGYTRLQSVGIELHLIIFTTRSNPYSYPCEEGPLAVRPH